MLQSNSDDENDHQESSSGGEEDVMLISQCATGGGVGKKIIRLQGWMNGKQVLILVDSGSSGSFISENTMKDLGLEKKEVNPITVTVADGGKTMSKEMVENSVWKCQGQVFQTELRVFGLSGYDIILGMDWLSEFSPMWIDWKKKIIQFRYGVKRITLKGVKDNTTKCAPISAVELQKQIQKRAMLQVVQLCSLEDASREELLPPEVEQVLSEHAKVFQEPQGLPPHRPFDHKIVLVPGAQPVNVKSYRYSPQQKDEIERQITEMLKQGIIKPSHSPFASPVLLVKKKMGVGDYA